MGDIRGLELEVRTNCSLGGTRGSQDKRRKGPTDTGGRRGVEAKEYGREAKRHMQWVGIIERRKNMLNICWTRRSECGGRDPIMALKGPS